MIIMNSYGYSENVISDQQKIYSKNLLLTNLKPFSVWYPLKGHTYLNKPAAENCGFV